ncbi:Nif3-like dinuclear metal center hexameric protein [Skermania piniformis]|uniref:GTP cyclohydrolase 1 type 2 homolog n=1 Tax=Skermania pinensis TaxID=39122 RepID=A0ABX8SDE5_9ACTN|nr:Nif3-like dinuclear metal center hexameric protein [Skermania piniformis]QXQ15004.1 Nif3-like dinuclear metal center hexameric protein [Skermania piniformis]
MTIRLADLIDVLDCAYPPHLAAEWDAVGLVCGDPDQPVSRVLLAVDPTAAVVDEALAWGAHALVAHHPLLLRGVTTVAMHTPKGALLHRLIRGGCALFTAHTNADSADPGVSDALADVLGLTVGGPIAPTAPGADTGIGRIGTLPAPESLRAFTERVVAALPATVWGVRAAGDPDLPVRRVAVSGGAGDSLLGAVGRLGVDAYLTADLRHHPADEHLRAGGPALIDVAHWASEFPWCAQAAGVLEQRLPGLAVRVSAMRTDPWSLGSTVEPYAVSEPGEQ